MGEGAERQIGKMVRVVLADDSAFVRRSVHRILDRQADIQIAGEAADGKQALQLVEELQPDVLLLDIQMPVMDGIDVIRSLREVKSPVRVLVLSGYAADDYVRLVLELGAAGYLIKDESPGMIAEAIRNVADGKRWSKRNIIPRSYTLEMLA